MVATLEKNKKIEYGDFQTPKELADLVCQKLLNMGLSPDSIIEPTCGLGIFIESAVYSFPKAEKIIGVEVNPEYVENLKIKSKAFPHSEAIEIKQGDFFNFNWKQLLKELDGEILILGNFPWVTNAAQSVINGSNLPAKANFQNYSGLDTMTGKSNFDISEFMLIQVSEWFWERRGHLAMLVKTSVARKFLNHLHKMNAGLSHAAIHKIDAMKYFGAAVDACLLYCRFDPSAKNFDYNVFESLSSEACYRVGHRLGLVVKDLNTFEGLKHLLGQSLEKWRSGIKHDCSEVMELTEKDGVLFNGVNELVNIESDFIYPLIKGSDVSNNRITQTNKFLIVPQKTVGKSTKPLKTVAPNLWAYLESHAKQLDERKSKIYQGNPRFSIFGVGDYTFSPWKIAICGLYKNLNFRLVGQIQNKPVVFDDTVYFLSFESLEEAKAVIDYLSSSDVQNFLSSLIFWDDKRPIKTSILNKLKLPSQDSILQQQLF